MHNIGKNFLSSFPWPLWIEDLNARIVFFNSKYEELYDVKLASVKGQTNREAFGEELGSVYDKYINQCIKTKSGFSVEGQVGEKIFSCYIFPLKDELGQVTSVVGIIQDITEDKERSFEIIKQKNILRTIIDSLPDAIFYKDTDSNFIGYNKQFENYYKQRGIIDILGKNDVDIYDNMEIAKNFVKQDKEVMTKKRVIGYEYSYYANDGTQVYEENMKVPVLDEQNEECFGVVGISRDITERKLMEAKLRYLSEIDILTGLYNRYRFEEKVKELDFEHYLPLGILMGDVNGLKLVNDTFGHLEGDQLLKNIANILKECCPQNGSVFRWGGDEFMILIPNSSESDCEELMRKIEEKCHQAESKFIQLSISMGEVVKKSLEKDVYKCIKQVEEKVYRHKLLQKKSIKSSILDSLVKTLEEKNMETEQHTERVVEYATALGKQLNFKSSELDELTIATRLHDIGKIGINEDILMKPSKLTDEEFEQIKLHPEIGYRIINSSSELGYIAKSVLTHHEKWDGSGYPLGLKGLEIPLMARIICIADSYDVMTHDRIYKKAMSKEDAINELKQCAGTQFDPYLVNEFISYLTR